MRKTCFLALLFLSIGLCAQERVIGMLPGERWWGCVTDLGVRMPFDASTELSFDLATQNFNNQTTPLFVSDKGRYIWCDSSFSVSISDGEIRIVPHHGGAVTCIQAGTTLREAFLAASAAHFPPGGTIPPEMFLNKPQYNTWIELVYDQNQADVLRYAHGIVDNGFPPGILMIDDNWQKYYGSTEFRPDRFPDPKGMVDELHAL
ncbi:MAG: glycoside hydrolase, partial [Bacteroidales bacterium]|nr:glycoside hydrolase [Bacteroidales bacterium]